MDSKPSEKKTAQFWMGDLERETGIEPATNGLGSRYSTIELLPLDVAIIALEGEGGR